MISLPREMGGTMCATENHRGAGAKSVERHSVFERGKHWVSDEQGGLNPGSVFWLFKWALAGNSDSNAYRSAGEEAARIFDFTKSHKWLAERVSKDEADRLRRPGREARRASILLSDDSTEPLFCGLAAGSEECPQSGQSRLIPSPAPAAL